MNLKNSSKKTPPSLVANMDGDIIFIDKSLISSLEGPRIGDNINDYLLENYTIRQDSIEVIKTKNLPYNTAILQVVGQGLLRTIQMQLWNMGEVDQENELCDKRLLESYHLITSNTVCTSMDINSFVDSVIGNMKADIRYSYRKFEISKSEESVKINGNFLRLSAIVVGIISILNEIEYKNPIKIRVEQVLGECVLKFSVPSNTFVHAQGVLALAELSPRVAMRLAYVTALCDSDEFNYDVNIMPNEIYVSLVLRRTESQTGRIFASVFDTTEKNMVSYAMDLFNYNLFSDIEGEEQE